MASKPNKKAIIYARYSSERQNEQSIEGQVRECRAFADREEITVVDTYIDRVLSGKTDARPSFQQMIKDSDKKAWDYVIVYRLDRFARNRYDAATYKHKLKRNGIKVLSAMERITDTPEGILMEGLLESMAEYYSEELSMKVRRGMTDNILKGLVVGGKTPLGYKIENKKYVIDPKTAPIVQEVFNLYAEGQTIAQILEHLNQQRYKTVHGSEFKKSSLERMLVNKKYIGIYEHSGQVVAGGTPVIIEKSVWEKVQAMMEKNKKAPARSRGAVEFLLTTKLHCQCGGSMAGTSGNGTHKTYYYYQCPKKCGMKNVPKDKLEDLVIDAALEVVSDQKTINHIAQTMTEIAAEERASDVKLQQLGKCIKDTEKQIQNITKAVKSGMHSETLANELTTLEKDLKTYKEDYHHIDLSYPKLDKEAVAFWLSSFQDFDKAVLSDRRKLVDYLIRDVLIENEKATITFNYSNDDLSIKPATREPHKVVRVWTAWWR